MGVGRKPKQDLMNNKKENNKGLLKIKGKHPLKPASQESLRRSQDSSSDSIKKNATIINQEEEEEKHQLEFAKVELDQV